MTNVGFATLQIIPSAKGFSGLLSRMTGRDIDRQGLAGGRSFGGAFKRGMAPVVGLGIAATMTAGIAGVARSAVGLEATFSQTMNTIAATTNTPAAGMKSLSSLAMKMGADTAFSAGDAADAMLELAKGGISAATIKGGALQGTLTLAAAGGTDLATAATIASNALNTFGLRGKDMSAVAAALAGGANASSASVESLGEALSQVGPGAKTAGLSLQETIAALSAFDAAGIKGSDAGTSLKTMLARLVPQTDKSRAAMKRLGLDFTDATGSFVPIANVAEQLRTRLGGLSEEQRTTALATLFGSDATRAATVLMNIGAKGVRGYTKATSDQAAAQRVADARMKGTAGALEQMRGSIETAKLALGQFLAPAVVAGARGLTGLFNGIGPAIEKVTGFLGRNRDVVLPIVGALGGLAAGITAVTGVTKTWALAQGVLNVALAANPVGLVVIALATLAGAAVVAYKRSDSFRASVQGLYTTFRTNVLPVLLDLWATFRTKVVPVLAQVARFIVTGLVPAITGIARTVAQNLAPILGALAGMIQANVLPAIVRVYERFLEWLPTIQRVVSVIITVGGWLLKVASWILGKVLPPLVKLAGFLLGTLIRSVAAVIGWVVKFVDVILDIGAAAGRAGGWVKEKFGDLVGFVKGLPGKIGSAASGMWDGIKNAFRGVINWIIGAWNRLEFKIPGFDPPGPGPTFSGFTLGVPNIPMLAKGGVATRATLAVIGEGAENEAVLPLSRLAKMLAGARRDGARDAAKGGDTYAPTLTINHDGGATARLRADLEEAQFFLRTMRRGGLHARA